MPESVKEPLIQTLFSGYIGQGGKVDKFEKELFGYIGNRYILSLNSGTSGLRLALRLAHVGPGDEVITTPMTCTATNMAIIDSGAKIIWADVHPVNGNIDANDIKRKISKRTKAIMIVHWGGYPCDIEPIKEIATKAGIKVIEDASHAMGASYNGIKIGNHTDYVVFSLQAVKHITTVDGGILCCQRASDYERGKRLRWFGIDRKLKDANFRHECEQDIIECGYKFHMNDICATIGIEQLKYVDKIVQQSCSNAEFYTNELKKIDKIALIPQLENRKGSYLFYTLHISANIIDFSNYMFSKGIMVSQVHSRNDRFTCFKPFCNGQLPGVDEFTRSMICIPSGWWITNESRIKIVNEIKSYFGRR
ncbi:dTDP-4-amino-4,6-dideoxygalactose transaminase [Desulfopila aestuarii DSM 18488]|uniref:dTDP-4-amino-4,6-dideoxygalactose transaminase n=2 Tax=Desulfopila aestuarii TaxID=231440 RepID=A0A1M7YLV0_9BACT|nr:dTDP-4-amino-4,6-dideoxygalactose transaminase [Desulfopila aestuarii DSM 18488]